MGHPTSSLLAVTTKQYGMDYLQFARVSPKYATNKVDRVKPLISTQFLLALLHVVSGTA